MQPNNVTDRLAQAVVKNDVPFLRNTLFSQTANPSNKVLLIVLLLSFVSALLSIRFCYRWQYAQILAALPNKREQYRLVDVGVPEGYETSGCVRIDDAGTVIGWAQRADEKIGEFRWRDGKFLSMKPSDLPHILRPFRTNDRGDVVADVHDGFDEIREIDSRAVLKVKRGFFTFPFDIWPEGSAPFRDVFAADVNNARQVVGSVCDWSSCHAFLWQGGAAMDLNTRLERKDWILYSADGINNSGWIAATGSRSDKSRAFLLVPLR